MCAKHSWMRVTPGASAGGLNVWMLRKLSTGSAVQYGRQWGGLFLILYFCFCRFPITRCSRYYTQLFELIAQV